MTDFDLILLLVSSTAFISFVIWICIATLRKEFAMKFDGLSADVIKIVQNSDTLVEQLKQKQAKIDQQHVEIDQLTESLSVCKDDLYDKNQQLIDAHKRIQQLEDECRKNKERTETSEKKAGNVTQRVFRDKVKYKMICDDLCYMLSETTEYKGFTLDSYMRDFGKFINAQVSEELKNRASANQQKNG